MRELQWDGAINLRDLGGLPTMASSTGQTRFGRMARGPRRELLTARGWSQAAAWGLRTVIDLRRPEEAGRRPGDPETSDPDWLRVVSAQIEDHNNPGELASLPPVLDHPAQWVALRRIQPERIRAALQALVDAGAGTLVHCSAGRDRTGQVSALALAAAGVDPAAIAEDHCTSVRVMARSTRVNATAPDRLAWSEDYLAGYLEGIRPVVVELARDPWPAFAEIGADDALVRGLRELLTTDSVPRTSCPGTAPG